MFASMTTYPSLFGDFDRLRREFDELFGWTGLPTSIRSAAPGAFPAVNIGHTPTSVEVYAFAPGVEPKEIDVTIDRGVMTITGERKSALPSENVSAARSACPRTWIRRKLKRTTVMAFCMSASVAANRRCRSESPFNESARHRRNRS
jgi:HSP20 family molecular chaperone IbpA